MLFNGFAVSPNICLVLKVQNFYPPRQWIACGPPNQIAVNLALAPGESVYRLRQIMAKAGNFQRVDCPFAPLDNIMQNADDTFVIRPRSAHDS